MNVSPLLHFSVCCALAAAQSAFAHDLWLEKDANGFILNQGHAHSDHAGAEHVPYPAGTVKSATCLHGNGTLKALGVGETTPWTTRAACTTLLVNFSTGYWTKTPWETVNAPGSQFGNAVKSWFSEESVKRIDAWTAGAKQPLGDGLEITPAADPFTLRPDDKLIVLVSEGKQPKAGVPVAYDGHVRGSSGPDGRIALRIRHGGMQMISASSETPRDDGKADVTIRATTLQFELPR